VWWQEPNQSTEGSDARSQACDQSRWPVRFETCGRANQPPFGSRAEGDNGCQSAASSTPATDRQAERRPRAARRGAEHRNNWLAVYNALSPARGLRGGDLLSISTHFLTIAGSKW